jgi:hypothetical protein
MHVARSIHQPIRSLMNWDELWKSSDGGLIACWERGRERALEAPPLASRAASGELPVLPWKGGHDKLLKFGWKYGALYYLAMWQGLRGEDLDINTDEELPMTCSATGMRTVFTANQQKLAQEN